MKKGILTINAIVLLVGLLLASWFTAMKVEHGDNNAGQFHFILSLPIIFIIIIANWLSLYFLSTFFIKKRILFLVFLIIPILTAIITILPFGLHDEVVLNINLTLAIINCLTLSYIKFIMINK